MGGTIFLFLGFTGFSMNFYRWHTLEILPGIENCLDIEFDFI